MFCVTSLTHSEPKIFVIENKRLGVRLGLLCVSAPTQRVRLLSSGGVAGRIVNAAGFAGCQRKELARSGLPGEQGWRTDRGGWHRGAAPRRAGAWCW